MENKIEISIIISIYNEENSLPELHETLIKVLTQIEKNWEIIYVDDGSDDNSLDLLKNFHQKNNKAKVLRLKHNYGQHAALMAGFKHSRGDIVICLDADLQNNPEDIPKFLDAISEGCDIVCGRRIKRKDPFLMRKLPSLIANKLFSCFTGITLNDYGCGFKAFNRSRINYILDFGGAGKNISLLGIMGAKKIKEIDISHSLRKYGKSSYTFNSLINLTMDIIISYSTIPFKLVGLLGLFFFMAGSVFLVVPAIGSKALLLTLFFLFIGLQLIILGFLGEYILRINQRMVEKPLYIIDFFLK